jgi:hypothetical protein
MPVTEITKNLQQQVLDALNVAQEAAVDGVRTIAEAVDPVIPDVPRPVADQATELVDSAFSFAEVLLKNQHEFVGKLLNATSPLFESKPQPASKKSAATA